MMLMMMRRKNDVGRGLVVGDRCSGGVGRDSSDSGQGVGVRGVVSQSWCSRRDGGRRWRTAAGHAGRVMVQRALVILLVMMVGHVVHRPGGVRARVHAVVMVMAGWRGMRVGMMG